MLFKLILFLLVLITFSVSDGGDAQLAWFKCTDPASKPEEKENYKKELINYCSKDTYAMYDLVNYFLKFKR
jgi:hypothetical protein